MSLSGVLETDMEVLEEEEGRDFSKEYSEKENDEECCDKESPDEEAFSQLHSDCDRDTIDMVEHDIERFGHNGDKLVNYKDNIVEGKSCSNCDKYGTNIKCLNADINNLTIDDNLWKCEFEIQI